MRVPLFKCLTCADHDDAQKVALIPFYTKTIIHSSTKPPMILILTAAVDEEIMNFARSIKLRLNLNFIAQF